MSPLPRGTLGRVLEVDLASGTIKGTGLEITSKPIPPFMLELINAGGLIPYLKRKLEEK